MPSIITNKYFKLLLIILLFFLVIALFGKNIVFIIDFPTLVFLAVGTTILTLIGYKKDLSKVKLLDKVKRNSIITGAAGFFVGFLMALVTTDSIERLPQNIAISLLIIPYTGLLYFAINAYKSYVMDSVSDSVHETVISDSNIKSNIYDIYSKYSLSEREKLIVDKLVEGASNKEIAEKLYVAENTVKKQISSIYKKTGVKSRYELICMVRNTPI